MYHFLSAIKATNKEINLKILTLKKVISNSKQRKTVWTSLCHGSVPETDKLWSPQSHFGIPAWGPFSLGHWCFDTAFSPRYGINFKKSWGVFNNLLQQSNTKKAQPKPDKTPPDTSSQNIPTQMIQLKWIDWNPDIGTKWHHSHVLTHLFRVSASSTSKVLSRDVLCCRFLPGRWIWLRVQKGPCKPGHRGWKDNPYMRNGKMSGTQIPTWERKKAQEKRKNHTSDCWKSLGILR